MNSKELRYSRHLLLLTAQEAATQIGNCSVRTWQNWENGKSTVPKDVKNKIIEMLYDRFWMIVDFKDKLRTILDTTKEDESGNHVKITIHISDINVFRKENPDSDFLLFKSHQSAAAAVFAENPNHVQLL